MRKRKTVEYPGDGTVIVPFDDWIDAVVRTPSLEVRTAAARAAMSIESENAREDAREEEIIPSDVARSLGQEALDFLTENTTLKGSEKGELATRLNRLLRTVYVAGYDFAKDLK